MQPLIYMEYRRTDRLQINSRMNDQELMNITKYEGNEFLNREIKLILPRIEIAATFNDQHWR